PTEFTILSLELLDPLSLCRRRTRPLAQIPLGLPHPATERLARAADLCSNRLDGRPLRRILTLVLEHQPNRPLPHLGGVLLCLSHDPNLSRVGVSSKPGAIQAITQVGLRLERDDNPPRHASIAGWPPDKHEWRSLAQELAAAAELHVRPGGPAERPGYEPP